MSPTKVVNIWAMSWDWHPKLIVKENVGLKKYGANRWWSLWRRLGIILEKGSANIRSFVKNRKFQQNNHKIDNPIVEKILDSDGEGNYYTYIWSFMKNGMFHQNNHEIDNPIVEETLDSVGEGKGKHMKLCEEWKVSTKQSQHWQPNCEGDIEFCWRRKLQIFEALRRKESFSKTITKLIT